MLTFSIDLSIGEVMTAASLFEELPKSSLEREWVSELFFKSLNGCRFNSEDNFDISAYTAKCEYNKVFCDYRNVTPLLSAEEYQRGYVGVLETRIPYEQKEFDLLIEHLNLQNVVEEFRKMQEFILIEEGKSLYHLLKLSLQFADPSRVENIITLMNKYSMQELLMDILSNAHALQILELA
ncbi:hypothetical protein H1230_25160 [Paenibacillus sp. 19GGS1-52]|uniref:hypothetical protein n=1 Tax=Paenibacillus sp. 19GGS1-52 TaxID=2758563 RepID=UPI001EFC0165|nr:hypothetical protein [Paenibacillus sp. 19GGS1-52]ULO06279.1 hypothetical protein H1230_25160 [Paenibacillus sp. 19GGS1-52]